MPAYTPNTVEYLVALKVEEVRAYAQAMLHRGFLYQAVRFGSSEYDIQNINGAVTLAVMAASAGGWPADYAWITEDNTLFPLPTPTDMMLLGQAAAAFRSGTIFMARYHKDALLAMTSELNTLDDVAAYDYTLGWPE